MKTKEELNAIKSELDTLTAKMKELDENELKEVVGGEDYDFPDKSRYNLSYQLILAKCKTNTLIDLAGTFASSNKSTDPAKYEV